MDYLTPVFPFPRSVSNWRENNAHLQMRSSFSQRQGSLIFNELPWEDSDGKPKGGFVLVQ